MNKFTIDVIKEKLRMLKAERVTTQTTRDLADRIYRDPVTSKALAEESRSAMIECEGRLHEIDVEIKILTEDLDTLEVDPSE